MHLPGYDAWKTTDPADDPYLDYVWELAFERAEREQPGASEAELRAIADEAAQEAADADRRSRAAVGGWR